MILRETPDLLHTEPRRAILARFNSENCLVFCRTQSASAPPAERATLSIKAAWDGAEQYVFADRRVAVDDDAYFIVNAHRLYGSEIHAPRPVRSLAIYFRPGLPEEVASGLQESGEEMLDNADRGLSMASCAEVDFAEHLRPHDELVSPVLRYIARVAESGAADEAWYDEQYRFLLARMIRAQRGFSARTERYEQLRASQREEVRKRIGRARDFMLSSYDRDLTLADIAGAAHLSVFHFARLFRRVEGVSPYEFLQTKRATVAARLLATTHLPVDEIARVCGLNNRISLYRLCRRHLGLNPRGLRGRPAAA
jgi:AraC-like DNA-binding protein